MRSGVALIFMIQSAISKKGRAYMGREIVRCLEADDSSRGREGVTSETETENGWR